MYLNIVDDLTLTAWQWTISLLAFGLERLHHELGSQRSAIVKKKYQEILKLNFDLAQAKSIRSNWIDYRWLLHKWSCSFAWGGFWKHCLKFSSLRFCRYFLQNLCRSFSNILCFISRCQYLDWTWLAMTTFKLCLRDTDDLNMYCYIGFGINFFTDLSIKPVVLLLPSILDGFDIICYSIIRTCNMVCMSIKCTFVIVLFSNVQHYLANGNKLHGM